MTRRHLQGALCAAIGFQLILLIGMVTQAAIPLWTGTEIRVKTMPVDPRSLFRGNYAQLRYEFEMLPEGLLSNVEDLRIGEVVYVSLEQGEGGEYELAAASLQRPTGGTFLRGRVVSRFPPVEVTYGIEAFFSSEERALKLENDLRDGGTAVLMVTSGGRAALKDVVPGTSTE